MAGPAERAALAALDAARPAIARLDVSRNSEDLAADLIESWSAVETALRSLVGGSSLGGQALIRELRQRQMLSFEQANALAEFQAARDRAQRTDYKPSAQDINATRDAFLKLEAGLMASVNPPAPVLTPVSAASVAPTRPMPSGESLAGRRSRFPWGLALGALALVALVAAGAWWAMTRNTGDGTREGLALLSQGKREVARDVFKKAARDDPSDALPLVYLGRMFRDEQRFDSATTYLQAAIRRDPKSAPAYREMAKLLFLEGNYDLSRTFFIRAINVDNTDRESMGYLGCALMRLGRAQEAQSWLQRAGQGAWSGCAAGAPMPGGLPPA
ncbi:MAG TPA: tetratricopeptide repeat protein [Gemmatimonadaceae bacterium]|nr:tetratricopeptide repeat protein [Gemmatimonadaceae bacterium]